VLRTTSTEKLLADLYDDCLVTSNLPRQHKVKVGIAQTAQLLADQLELVEILGFGAHGLYMFLDTSTSIPRQCFRHFKRRLTSVFQVPFFVMVDNRGGWSFFAA
jgi:hypothetical protein